MEYRELNEKRRSINFFDPSVKIEAIEIRSIYEQAKLAPSSFNFQPWKVLVAHTPETKARLREASLNQPKVTEASAVLVLFGHTSQYREADDVFQDKIDHGQMKPEHVPGTVKMAENLYEGREDAFASRNVGLFAMNFMLAALDAGWETHPMDGFEVDRVREVFGLDRKYLPVMMIAIGKLKPGVELFPRSMRRDFDQVFDFR